MSLHVVTSIVNSQRYKSRYALYTAFAKHMRDSGAVLHTVEAAFGDRDWALADYAAHQDNPGEYTQLRINGQQEIWLKENLLNIGVSRLPHDWKYVAFVDADVVFSRPDWVQETIHQLQHYSVVQMFSDAIDLYPDYSPQLDRQQKSHAWCHVNGVLNESVAGKPAVQAKTAGYYSKPLAAAINGSPTVKAQGAAVAITQPTGNILYRHPGFAWAWTRDAYNAVGGLMDFVILGSADWHMAWALLGRVDETLGKPLSQSYKDACRLWQRRAVEHIKGNLGFVSGTLMHQWHGKKSARGYDTRWKIMADNQFDPVTDLKRDWQGVLQLTDKKPLLRDQCRAYFKQRSEDSIDI